MKRVAEGSSWNKPLTSAMGSSKTNAVSRSGHYLISACSETEQKAHQWDVSVSALSPAAVFLSMDHFPTSGFVPLASLALISGEVALPTKYLTCGISEELGVAGATCTQ
jgi:hypothetical protein